ncbi:MAG: hypothetical protein AAFQ67_08635 [Pseudomonadota bacterium]
MTAPTITRDRVLALIDAYGGDAWNWPESERDAAAALVSAEPDVFSDALAEARALDAALGGVTPLEPPAHLAERILAAAPRATSTQQGGGLFTWMFPQGRKWPAIAATAATMLGMAGGYGGVAMAATSEAEAEYALYRAFDGVATFEFETYE